MRVGIVGAGPAGLLFALLIRRRFPGSQVRVFEQNLRGKVRWPEEQRDRAAVR